MTFHFDTSGVVQHVMVPGAVETGLDLEWHDLSPFVQGYGRDMAEALYERLVSEGMDPAKAAEAVAFRNWAPETLARIMEDCERWRREYTGSTYDLAPQRRNLGQLFWDIRQAGKRSSFPPLMPYLGDDGLFRLREGA